MKAEMLIRVTSHAQSLDGLMYTGKKDKKVTAQGKETVSQSESNLAMIQGALGLCRLSPFISNLLYAKYQNYQSPNLESQVSEYLFRKWSGPPLDVVRAAKLILQEYLHHHRCIACSGTERRMVVKPERDLKVGQVLVCSLCRGTGKKKPTDGARADYLGIHREIWKRKYAVPYAKSQSLIDGLVDRGESEFSYRVA